MTRITRVLCPIDFSETSRHAFDHAAAVARWYEAPLTLMYVFASLPTLDLPPLVLEPEQRERLVQQMRQWTAGLPSSLPIDIRVEQAEYVHEEILQQVSATHSDLLVLGTHGRSGFERFFLGSVAEKVIRKAPCPTLVVPPRAPDVAPASPIYFRRILCPTDFSPCSLRALEYACSLAQEADATLTLLHVIDIPPELREDAVVADFDVDRIRAAAEAEARRRLRELVSDETRTYCTVHTAVVEGLGYREVLRQAAEDRSDLIVMGVRGRGALDLLVFGSTTYRVIRAATCPVLIVRGHA
jgi:nucleotide-binding universal stress UspA family protein